MSLVREFVAATTTSLSGLPQRIYASIVAVLGVAITVAVMTSLLAIGAGLVRTSNRNVSLSRVIVLPTGAPSEYAASMTRETAAIIGQAPGVKHASDGRPIVDGSSLVLVEIQKKEGGTASTALRGLGPMGLSINPAIKLVGGRLFRPAVHELIVGKAAQRRYAGLEVGDRVVLRGTEWLVVGAFDANGGLEDNQLLADADTVMAAFGRPTYQGVYADLDTGEDFNRFREALLADPRLNVEVKRYKAYLDSQLEQLTSVMNFVGYFVGGVMAIGATICAINSMYSVVESRTREIATLRAIGFGGASVVFSIIMESLILSIFGALIGAASSWLVFNDYNVNALGLNFPLAVTPPLLASSMVLAVGIGLVGGIMPALRAATLPVAAALRAI